MNDASALRTWKGELKLGFEQRSGRTVLAQRRHAGPLYVQKVLYPEGPAVCHAIVLHPPGGLAAGDELRIEADVGPGAHALISTPAATKWYKSTTAPALQSVRARLQDKAHLEWLPQENIFFRRVAATNRLVVELPETATASGWEILALGRIASGEAWDEGYLRLETTLVRSGGPLIWTERAALTGRAGLLRSPHGLGGFRILGTLWATGPTCLPSCAEALAPMLPFTGALRAGVTHLPGNVLTIRALGDSLDAVRTAMIEWWTKLRPLVHNVPAKPLRLWAT